MEYEFVRKDTKKEKYEVGVFKHVCICTRGFKYSQGLGSHQLACETAKVKTLKQEKEDATEVEMTHNKTMFSRNRTAAERWNQEISDSRQSKESSITDVSNRT